MIFRSTRMGAFFYVRPEMREQAATLMLENGYVPVAPGKLKLGRKGLSLMRAV